MTTVLSRLSPVEIGSAFERHSLLFLNHHLHMSLRRVGGAGDEGIDLKGWWYVPSTAQRIDSTSRKALDVQESLVLGPSESGLEKGKRTGKHKGLDKGKGKEVEKEVVEVESPADWIGGFGEDLSTGVAHKRVRVVAQCKAERAKINGRAVRELEGVMGHLYGKSSHRPGQHHSLHITADRASCLGLSR